MRLLLSLLLLLLAPPYLTAPLPLPLTPRAAPFPSLTGLTPLTADHTRPPPPRHALKYFTESSFHPHYDGRFAAAPLPSAPERRLHLALLIRSYALFARRAGVRTWIMHGSLLGWWWGGGVLGWDSDVDFCVLEEGVGELGAWWNMTVHAYRVQELGVVVDDWEGEGRGGGEVVDREGDERIKRPDGLADATWAQLTKGGKKYLLEVNPHSTSPSTQDRLNRIDARWIDVTTGLFIDITAVHPVPRGPPSFLSSLSSSLSSFLPSLLQPAKPQQHDQEPQEMFTKDTHLYATAALFPLRSARFEGTAVAVPYDYEQLLVEEYGARALTETWFDGYRFEKSKGEWVVAPPRPVGGFEQGGEGRGKGSLLVDGDEGARSKEDNKGQAGYATRPGRVGDVHVVPGGG